MKPLLEEKEHLENGTHPDFVVGLKKLETEYEEELGKIANREMVRPHKQGDPKSERDPGDPLFGIRDPKWVPNPFQDSGWPHLQQNFFILKGSNQMNKMSKKIFIQKIKIFE